MEIHQLLFQKFEAPNIHFYKEQMEIYIRINSKIYIIDSKDKNIFIMVLNHIIQETM